MMRNETKDALQRAVSAVQIATAMVREDQNIVAASGDHVEMIYHFNDTRLAVEQIKESREALNEMADYLSRDLIPTTFALLRQRTGQKPPFTIEGVGRVTVSHRYSCTMLDKAEGINWLKAKGHGAIVQETVNAQTLAAFSKDLLENQGIELPDDIFKVGTSPFTSITKVK